MMQEMYNQIARQFGTTPECVQAEILNAIQIGMTSPDPAVQERWAQIPRQALVPTPEEVIAYLVLMTSGCSQREKQHI